MTYKSGFSLLMRKLFWDEPHRYGERSLRLIRTVSAIVRNSDKTY